MGARVTQRVSTTLLWNSATAMKIQREAAGTGRVAPFTTVRGPRAARRRRMNQTILAFVLLAACSSGSDDLDADVVTNLPPGDATGSALSGSYRMEALTTKCSGKCSTTIDSFAYSACDVGTRQDDTVEITQTDGALRIDVEDSDYVSRLAGGVDTTGVFDVGGLRTQLGGDITIIARSHGTIVGTSLTGDARLHVGGRGLDCLIEIEVTGTKR